MAKINVYQRELYHHGILGQKWGRKMGPPYPLGAGDHSAAEKKEGYKKSLGGGRNESLYDRKDKKIDRLNKKYYKDKRIAASMVIDKKTGEHIGVSKEVLRKKGTDAAIKDARNPKSLDKTRRAEAEYFDKSYKYYLSKEKGDKKEAYNKAVQNFMENTGLTKKSTEDFVKKYSKEVGYDDADKPLNKREIKKKAKNYENAINQLEKNEMDLQLANWNLDAAKAQAKAKMEKAKKEGNLEKAESYLNDLQIMYKKYNEIQTDYSMNRAAIDNLINKIDSDPDILYTVKNAYSYGGKNLNEYAKVLNDKYGTESNKYYNLGGERSMSGSRFKVTNNTARKSKKKKYSDSKYKKEKQHVRNETYYYTY